MQLVMLYVKENKKGSWLMTIVMIIAVMMILTMIMMIMMVIMKNFMIIDDFDHANHNDDVMLINVSSPCY